jgi:transposase-like protein
MEGNGRGKRYSEALKLEVVEAIERGRLSPAQAQRQYGISGSCTIEGWLRRYGKPGGNGFGRSSRRRAAAERYERLARERDQLEQALVRASLKVAALEALVEEAEAQYGEAFKKNFATARSSGRGRDWAAKG